MALYGLWVSGKCSPDELRLLSITTDTGNRAWGGGSSWALCWALSFYIAEVEWSKHASLDLGVFRKDPHLRQPRGPWYLICPDSILLLELGREPWASVTLESLLEMQNLRSSLRPVWSESAFLKRPAVILIPWKAWKALPFVTHWLWLFPGIFTTIPESLSS